MKSIGVKEIAYFVHASGDLTVEFSSNKSNQEGKEAHAYLQSKFDEFSVKELYVKQEVCINGQSILINGFIDGVHHKEKYDVIEEIKSTNLELDQVGFDYHLEYLAQLKLYGYLYGLDKKLNEVHLRLTFISTITYETKSFDTVISFDELEEFFFDTVTTYLNFFNQVEQCQENKIKTIADIKFPFKTMRQGQRDLMAACFQTMKRNDILYSIAPTGVGKTMATLFSSLKTITSKEDKLFYTTAKGMGKKVAVNAVNILQFQGLKMKSIVLTAKSKCCQAKQKNCNPEVCPFAKGFFSRLKDAIMDIFNYDGIYDYETINEYANKHKICAFEFSLELSNFCDLIIADYNYVFDPRAHLIRYFDDTAYKPKVLVDEAHNLIDRSKEMYSAKIDTEILRKLRKRVTGQKPTVRKEINKAIEILESYESKLSQTFTYYQDEIDNSLTEVLYAITRKCDQIFADNKEFEHRDEALEAYFEVYDFLRISEYYCDVHKTLVTKNEKDDYEMMIRCFDASKFIYDVIKKSIHGIVFFSATLFPIKYHMDLLTGGVGKFLNLESPFDQNNLKLLVNDQIVTKYNNRTNTIDDIIETIEILTSSKNGNYIVFFPSYAYMQMVLSKIDTSDFDMYVQKPNMSELDRDEIFNKFYETKKTKVGMFVMGGVFSEGLDYIGDLLSGVIIVGVGIPQVCLENDLAKEFFDVQYSNGFDYAYTYPGFNKVVQAAGRVIRSETDKGVVILLDYRYKFRVYNDLMPKFWSHRKYISSPKEMKKELIDFWNKK